MEFDLVLRCQINYKGLHEFVTLFRSIAMVRGIHDIPWIIHHIRSLWWNIMQNIVSPT